MLATTQKTLVGNLGLYSAELKTAQRNTMILWGSFCCLFPHPSQRPQGMMYQVRPPASCNEVSTSIVSRDLSWWAFVSTLHWAMWLMRPWYTLGGFEGHSHFVFLSVSAWYYTGLSDLTATCTRWTLVVGHESYWQSRLLGCRCDCVAGKLLRFYTKSIYYMSPE